MFSALKRIFVAKPKVERVPLSHQTLGVLTYSEDEAAWLSEPTIGFRFRLAGEEGPDGALIAHAESVARDPSTFKRMVAEFLEVEARISKDKEDTVRGLEIEMLCLFWPERPNDGMIYFTGGDQYGVWRCDYKNGAPVALGFDS
jgi:hypothetical protein